MNQTISNTCRLLSEAGEAIIAIYNSGDFKAELKSDNSPVTIADKTSSKIINAGLQELYSNIPVLDEESPIPDFSIRKDWNQYFLLDPLDGTKEFIKRNGEFCINLALMENSKPVEGWIYQPLAKRGWYCKKGEGIFEFDSTQNFVRLEKYEEKENKIRIVASRSFFKPLEAEIIKEIEKHYSVEIIHQGSSLKQIAIVLNKVDLYIKSGPCSEWDTAPGQLMVEEFGGAVLKQSNFETMQYNKQNLINPHFCMFNSRLNKAPFIHFIRDTILKFK